MYFNDKENPFKEAIDVVLSVLKKNKTNLKKNPNDISPLIKLFNYIFIFNSKFNKKYEIKDEPFYILEKIFNKDEVFLNLLNQYYLYWDEKTNSIWNHGQQVVVPLEGKEDKTVEEHVSVCLNPKYKYSTLFSDKYSVYNAMFNATTMVWKGGFLMERESLNPVLEHSAKLNPLFAEEVRTVMKSKELVEAHKNYASALVKYQSTYEFLLKNLNQQDDKEKIIEELKEMSQGNENVKAYFESFLNQKPAFSSIIPLTRESNLLYLPKNAHESYVKAAKEWANYLIKYKELDEKSKKIAKSFLKKLA